VIRSATADDVPTVLDLWRAFELEVPDAVWRDDDSEHDIAELERAVEGADIVLLAEQNGEPIGLSVAEKKGERLGFLHILYVRPEARRSGVAADLVRETAEQLRLQGAEMLELEVLASNEGARGIYDRWGFAPVELTLAARVDDLVARLDTTEKGPTFGSIHVQTDDVAAVERAVQKALPRLGRSAGTHVSGPDNGWVHVHDELCDRDPKVLHRLAKELSYATGGVVLAIGVEEGAVVHYTLFDRGGAVDEYVSVPEYFGPLPPGDVVALGANPTVVSRLTGAEPARVREVARTGASLAELPPALELLDQLASVFGVAEATHGWER
jgi:ribosomal protein S18 acetylase RimI-like enzyme